MRVVTPPGLWVPGPGGKGLHLKVTGSARRKIQIFKTPKGDKCGCGSSSN